jgi:hypothetical protein
VRSRRELIARLYDQYYVPRYGHGENPPEPDGADAGPPRGSHHRVAASVIPPGSRRPVSEGITFLQNSARVRARERTGARLHAFDSLSPTHWIALARHRSTPHDRPSARRKWAPPSFGTPAWTLEWLSIQLST